MIIIVVSILTQGIELFLFSHSGQKTKSSATQCTQYTIWNAGGQWRMECYDTRPFQSTLLYVEPIWEMK